MDITKKFGSKEKSLKKLIYSGILLPKLINYFGLSSELSTNHKSPFELNLLSSEIANLRLGIPSLIPFDIFIENLDEKLLFLYLYYFYDLSLKIPKDTQEIFKKEEDKDLSKPIFTQSKVENLIQNISDMFLSHVASLQNQMKLYNQELFDKLEEQAQIIQKQNQIIENLKKDSEIRFEEQKKELQDIKHSNELILNEISILKESPKSELDYEFNRKTSLSIEEPFFYDDIPTNFQELLLNQKGIQFYLKKYPDDDKYINSYQNLTKLKDLMSKCLTNDNYLIKMEKIYNIIESMADKSYIYLIDDERYRSKDPKTFSDVHDKLYQFLSQKYEKLKTDTMWNEIHKLQNTSKSESKLRSLSFWKGGDQSPKRKSTQQGFEELGPFEKIFSKVTTLELFKKYSESEKFKEELLAMIEIKSFQDFSFELLKDKKLSDLYEKVYQNYKLMNSRCSSIFTGDLNLLVKIEFDLYNHLQNNFQLFQKSLFWEEFIKTQREPLKLNKKGSTPNLFPIKKKYSSGNLQLEIETKRKTSSGLNEEERRKIRSITNSEAEEVRKRMSINLESPRFKKGSPKIEVLEEYTKRNQNQTKKQLIVEEEKPVIIEENPKKKEMTKEGYLFEMARAGKMNEFIEGCIEMNDWKCLLDKDNRTFLHHAIMSRKIELVEYLIQKGLNIDAEDKEYKTPLHYACLTGNREIVYQLLGNKCKVNVKDANGLSPLMICLKKHHFELADDLILFNANINFKRDNGYTVLHDAVTNEDLESVKWIINQKVKFNYNQKDSNDQTAFYKSLDTNNPQVFLELLNVPNIDLSMKDERNFIHLIIQKQKIEFLKIFIGKEDLKKYQKYFTQSYQGKYPIHLAVETKNFKLVATLATILKSLQIKLNVLNSNHQTPLDLIIMIAEQSLGIFLNTLSSDEQKKMMENIVKIRKFLENNLND